MIDRFDVSCNLDNLKSGRYVLYEDHLAEIAEAKKEIERLKARLNYFLLELDSLDEDGKALLEQLYSGFVLR